MARYALLNKCQPSWMWRSNHKMCIEMRCWEKRLALIPVVSHFFATQRFYKLCSLRSASNFLVTAVFVTIYSNKSKSSYKWFSFSNTWMELFKVVSSTYSFNQNIVCFVFHEENMKWFENVWRSFDWLHQLITFGPFHGNRQRSIAATHKTHIYWI